MRFECPKCHKSLNVKDEFAGKQARCPACKGVLTVPSASASGGDPPPPTQPAAPSEASAAEGVRPCPGCGAELSKGIVFCVKCGHDLRTGKQLKAADSNENDKEDADE